MRTMQEEISKWASKNNMPLKKSGQKRQKNKDKPMSTREIKELMGVYQPTYKRTKGGAIRQK